MSADNDDKNLKKFMDRQQDTTKPASSTPMGETLMIPEICRLIAEYQKEQEGYKQKYLELLYHIQRGKEAFEGLAANRWKDEAECARDCVIGIT